MESVKKECVSPLLVEGGGGGGGGGGSYDPSTRNCVTSPPATPVQNTNQDLKPPIKTYLPQQPPSQPQPQPQPQPHPPQTTALPSPTLPSVITTVSSQGGGAGRGVEVTGVVVDSELIPHQATSFSGEIGEAVSKILEDYDWSKIPLANK